MECISSIQASQCEGRKEGIKEDGVYCQFDVGALWEMLHDRFDQIHSAKPSKLAFYKLSIPRIYEVSGSCFPHNVFVPFLQQLDVSLKKVVNPMSFNEHAINLIKVCNFTILSIKC